MKAPISVAQARAYAAQAGFTGKGLDTIAAIAQAESSLVPDQRHINGDGTVDRGILQFNSRWHAEVNNACADSPSCAFKQAYRVTSFGIDFKDWNTYTGGAYLRYMPTSTGTSGNNGGLPTTKQWWDFPRVDNLRTIDPQGNYWKPDSNIQTPPDFPIEAGLAGTVTDVSRTSWGQSVVTIKLDKPINSAATHDFFEHMHDATVTVGQHVSPTTLVGHANKTGEGAPLGFGLYSGDKFGSGPSWAQEQADLAPGGTGLLDPVQLLNSLNSGSFPTGSGDTGTGTTGTGSNSSPVPISDQVNTLLSEFPGFAGIAIALDQAERFPGIVWYNPNTSISLVPGGSVGNVINGVASAVFDPTDYLGAGIRSILDTIFSNFTPLLVRGFVTMIGLLLIVGLVWKAIGDSGVVQDAAQVAMVAA